jgi:hypothetical protein
LVIFIGATLLVALLAHFGRSFYVPLNPIETDQPELPKDDDKEVELEDISS